MAPGKASAAAFATIISVSSRRRKPSVRERAICCGKRWDRGLPHRKWRNSKRKHLIHKNQVFYGCGDRTRTCDLRVMRQSQAQIGVVSAPTCAFYRHSFGEFSIVSVHACPLFSDSGSKVGQKLSMSGLRSWVSISKACYIRATPISYFGTIYIFGTGCMGQRTRTTVPVPPATSPLPGIIDVGMWMS